MRRVEILQLLLQSEDLKGLVGFPGVAEIFRKVLDGVGIDVEAMPSPLEIKGKAAEMEAQQAAQAQAEIEAAQAAAAGPPMGRTAGADGHAMTGQDVSAFQGAR